MLTEIGCIAAGIPIGFLLRKRTYVIDAVDKLTMWTIYCLLFLLGITLGSDQTIMTQLDTIGLQAFVISVCCILGSALATWCLERFLLKGRLDEK